MPSGNGNRAMLKRERNAKKAASESKGGQSQIKVNEKAMNIICQVGIVAHFSSLCSSWMVRLLLALTCIRCVLFPQVCRQVFMNTTKVPELEIHRVSVAKAVFCYNAFMSTC